MNPATCVYEDKTRFKKVDLSLSLCKTFVPNPCFRRSSFSKPCFCYYWLQIRVKIFFMKIKCYNHRRVPKISDRQFGYQDNTVRLKSSAAQSNSGLSIGTKLRAQIMESRYFCATPRFKLKRFIFSAAQFSKNS